MMYPRLKLLHQLLAEDGSLWVTIDDNEAHYLKVLLDEIFGRSNFINTISVNMKNNAGASGGGEDKKLKKNIEYIHVFSKKYEQMRPFENVYDYSPMSEVVEKYRKEGKSWKYTAILIFAGDKKFVGSTVDGDGNEIKIYLRLNPIYKSINQVVKEENITEKEAYDKYAGKIFEPKDAQSSIRARVIEARNNLFIDEDLISIEYVPKTGRNRGILYEQFYKGENCRLFAWLMDVGETIDGVLYKKNRLGTYWDATSSINNLSKEGDVQFPNGKKPESLINKIIQMCTQPNDLVLDSFLGSGTTAAVAHKMGRRWIGIEAGEHAETHCIPRLQKVIDGEQGGISQSAGWKGGGGFAYYTLGEAIFTDTGHINPGIKFADLANYVWQSETSITTPLPHFSPNRKAQKQNPTEHKEATPLLGLHDGTAYFLLYNGILKDRRPESGNVLTLAVWQWLKTLLAGKESTVNNYVIFGDACIGIPPTQRARMNMTFKQMPYKLQKI